MTFSRRYAALAATLAIVARVAPCDADKAALSESPWSLSEVVARMAKMDQARMQSLQEYSSIRRYTLVNKRFGISAEIRVRMLYQQPGTKKFEVLSEQGSSVIRKRVLHRLIKTELEATRPDLRGATRIAPDNYNFSLQGMETDQGRPCYVLLAEPKSPTKYLFRGRLWVDAEDFAIARIEGVPAVKPSFWIQKTAFVHQYRRFGAWWLPVSNNSETDVRVFGKTLVSVEYGDYRINETESAPAGALRGGGGNH